MNSVVVVGSIGVDLVAYAPRLPAKGETILGDNFERFPGAKGANQAVAAAFAGARVAMVGAVGNDANGAFMKERLASHGVDVTCIETVEAATQVALIMVGGGDNQIVVVPGANMLVDEARIASLPFAKGDVCVAQGETTIDVVQAAFSQAKQHGAVTMFNPAPAAETARGVLPLADFVLVNETESEFLAGERFDPAQAENLLRRAARALDLRGDQTLIVTLGDAGVAALHRNNPIQIGGHRVQVADTTGAGDCFVGTFAASLTRGDDPHDALREANAAAALSVSRKGALSQLPDPERDVGISAPMINL